jgi:hypothetical protein
MILFYGMKHDYFENWSTEMAYYLGWIWADGNISDGKLQIGCTTEDEEIVVGLRNAIHSKHKITRLDGYWHKKGYYVKPYTKIAIYSKKLISCLVNKHGILPNKTYLNLPFPNIEEQYLSHFIRGYFDGDGCIFKNKKNLVGVTLIGTKMFVDMMNDEIGKITKLPQHPSQKSKNTKSVNAAWSIVWNKKADVLTFLNFIYSDGPYLSRKKDLVDKFLPELIEYCEGCGIENKNNRIRLRFMTKNLGDYQSIPECKWARNYVYQKIKNCPYPIAEPAINQEKQKLIMKFIDAKLDNDPVHQRQIIKSKTIRKKKEKN